MRLVEEVSEVVSGNLNTALRGGKVGGHPWTSLEVGDIELTFTILKKNLTSKQY